MAPAKNYKEALQDLLEYAVGNRGTREGNPYGHPEIRQAMKLLAKKQGIADWLSAVTQRKGGLDEKL